MSRNVTKFEKKINDKSVNIYCDVLLSKILPCDIVTMTYYLTY